MQPRFPRETQVRFSKTELIVGGIAGTGVDWLAGWEKSAHQWLRGWLGSVGEEGGGFDAGHLKRSAAAYFLTGDFIVEQDHVAGGLGKLGAIPFVCISREAINFAAHQPAKIVGIARSAERAAQSGRLCHLRFTVEGALIHN